MKRLLPLLLVLGACAQEPSLPADHAQRQKKLCEAVVQRARRATKDRAASADIAAAIAEVVVPAMSPHLRLLAASDDVVVARGAATALVRILLFRDEDDTKALRNCAATESNTVVRGECLARLGTKAPEDVALLEAAVKSGDLETKRGVERAGQSAKQPERIDVDALESEDPLIRRQMLRRVLATPDDDVKKLPRIDGIAARLLEDKDELVRLLVASYWLRRSLALAPPSKDPALGLPL